MCDLQGQQSGLADGLQKVAWLHLPSAVTAYPGPNAPCLQGKHLPDWDFHSWKSKDFKVLLLVISKQST